MPTRRREGNRPDRRILPAAATTDAIRRSLDERLCYVGSAHHKLRPGDYGFVPSHNPRPSKSVCDDMRPLLRQEASELFRAGIMHGMVSALLDGDLPKYVWAVDALGEVYEAKLGSANDYHGYRLGDDEKAMREYVRLEWKRRCR